jgi:integration host factor subunit beta
MPQAKYRKSDIVKIVHEKTGFDNDDVKETIDLFLGEVKDMLLKGGAVELRGFGTFEVRRRAGRRVARNPFNGTSIQVPEHGAAVWKPGKEIKRGVWNAPSGGDEPAS